MGNDLNAVKIAYSENENLLERDEKKSHYDEENAIFDDWEYDGLHVGGCLVAVAFILAIVGLVVWKLCF